jgi:hypothetical protein
MGYTTEFTGHFKVTPALDSTHMAYINAFSDTRRMTRDVEKASNLPDTIREKVGLPIGKEGGYFVGGGDDFGQEHDLSIVDYNNPPNGQPSLWCQWVAIDNEHIGWNDTEKFYEYILWIKYLITNFLKPWGYIINGEVEWQGEDSRDIGKIIAKDNKVTTKHGKVVYS